MSERRARMAVIGVGIWGQNHALVYATYPRAELVCICDQNEERGRQFAERYGCRWTPDYHDLIDSEVEAVSVATPDYAHAAPALAMIRAGKHVLIEKPMTTSVEEARQIVAAQRETGVKVMVDFQQRWNPAMHNVKEAIDNGQLGKPVMGYIRLSDAITVATDWFTWSSKSGPHWFLFPHTMDIIRWLIKEEPRTVYARGAKGVLSSHGVDTYDAVQAMIQFDTAFVTFETSWIVPNSWPSVVDYRMSLYGTKGKVELTEDFKGLQIAGEKFAYPWVPVGRPNIFGKVDHFLYEPIRHFVDCVVEDKPVHAPAEDGLINVRMIAATMRSVEEGRPVSMEEV